MFEKMPLYNLEEPFYKHDHHWVPQINFAPEVISAMPKSVVVHDVTLRDGEQMPGVTFTEDERVRIAEGLIDLGVGRIEAGMPAVSATQNNALKRITKLPNKKSQIYGFGRTLVKDVELVIEAGCTGIVCEHTVNPYLCEFAYGLTPKALIERLTTAFKFAKDHGLKTSFMGWDWCRSPIEWTKWIVTEVLNQVELDGIVMVDTFGDATPAAIEYLFKTFKGWFPEVSFEFHGHNDFNLGNAACFSALSGGAECIHTAANGLGERCGNVALEEFVMSAEILYGIDTGVDYSKIYDNAQTISTIAKLPIAKNKCILGERAYQIESGITTHWVGSVEAQGINPTAVPFLPAIIGRTTPVEYVMGKNSGKGTIVMFLKHFGLEATPEQIDELVAAVKAEGIVTKDLVSPAMFVKIYHKICC